jgi:hypothetical protein
MTCVCSLVLLLLLLCVCETVNRLQHRYTVVILVVVTAIAGQVAFKTSDLSDSPSN